MDDTLARQFAELRFGDHLCVVYEKAAEAFAVAVPFLAQGLARGERCAYIAGEHQVDQIVAAMATAGVDVRHERERGALELLPTWIEPIQPGEFGPETLVDVLEQKVTDAVASGYAGLRLGVDMTWLTVSGVGLHRWIEFETWYANHFADRPIVAICLYNRARFPAPILRDALRTHPLVVLDDVVFPNTFYEPPDLFVGQGSVARQIGWMTDQLRRARQVEEEHAQLVREQAERTAAERTLNRVRTILESIGDGFYAVNRDWRFIYVNRKGAELLGKTLDELSGRTVWEAFPDASHSHFCDEAQRAMSEQVSVVVEELWPPAQKLLEFRLHPSAEGLTIHGQDVTERKRGEEVMARLAAIVESSEDAIISRNLDESITTWNKAAERLFGYTAEEIQGKERFVLVPAEQRGLAVRRQQRMRRGERVPPIETVRVGKDGRPFEVSLTTATIKDASGQVIGQASIVRDISARKALERQQADAVAALTQLQERERIAMDLHDGVVQSLYAVTLGLARLERLPAEGDASMRDGVARARRQIGQVIEDIRVYLQALPGRETRSGGLRARLAGLVEEFGIASLTRLTPRAVSPALAEAEAALGPPATEDILQVARDALANVARHAGASAVLVRLEVVGDRLVLTVRDDGQGFDPRASGDKPDHGLRNMAERARRLGARLQVTSRPEWGTRIRLAVPIPSRADVRE